MKYLIALLIIIFIASLGMSATLIVINTSLNWGLETANRTLDKCVQELNTCNQYHQIRNDLEAQDYYRQNLDPIDIYNEEELSEFYIIPTTEEVYIEPPKVEKVCIEWKYYAWGNDVCQGWANPL